MNQLTWVGRIALGLLAAGALFAQAKLPVFDTPETAAPTEVNQALRDRVTQFFNFHVGTPNRRAIDLVAEDTKDYYFASGKLQMLGFNVKAFKYTKDLQRASVELDVKQMWRMQEFETEVTTPVFTTWKLEDGKWVWYLEQQPVAGIWSTPMGPSAAPGPRPTTPQPLKNADGTLYIPEDFAKPERVTAQAQSILAQAGLNKGEIRLNSGTPGQDKVTFHNGFTGPVSISLSGDPRIPGLTIKLDKADLGAGEDAVISFDYAPAQDARPEGMTATHTLRLLLMPFNQEYPIRLTMQGLR